MSTKDEFIMNFEQDAKVDSSEVESVSVKLSKFAEEANDILGQIEELEDQMSDLNAKYREITEVKMPTIMDEIGMEKFVTNSGIQAICEKIIAAGITDKNRNAAMSWLRSNGHDDLIKNEISLHLGKGDAPLAEKIAIDIHEKFGVPVSRKELVHPQTLKAFVKEQLQLGKEIPSDLFGVYIGRKVKIKK